MDFEKEIAKALLGIGAVGFKPNDPVTFKSGIVSPVYVDNRLFTSHPEEWKRVIDGFKEIIEKNDLPFDMIAGIEAGGISHSAVLGYTLDKPMVYVKKEFKEHGKKKRIEGGEVGGKRVLLIEDLITTGGSALSGVKTLREAGATVEDCLVIVSYDLKEAKDNFAEAKVNLHTLTSFPIILEEYMAIIEDWFKDPHGWAGRHGF